MSAEMDKAGHFVARHDAIYRPLYRIWCLPNKEWQRAKLEALRFKWRYRTTDVRVIDRLARAYKAVFGA